MGVDPSANRRRGDGLTEGGIPSTRLTCGLLTSLVACEKKSTGEKPGEEDREKGRKGLFIKLVPTRDGWGHPQPSTSADPPP
jgi:hypothetical protein